MKAELLMALAMGAPLAYQSYLQFRPDNMAFEVYPVSLEQSVEKTSLEPRLNFNEEFSRLSARVELKDQPLGSSSF